MIIDAHQHFWNPARDDYGWLPKNDAILNRIYSPEDLKPYLEKTGVSKTILIQAAPSIEETEYMLGIADATPFILAVVGWIDFESPEHLKQLERLAKHPKFVGVRPMIQDIEDINWMLRKDINWAFEALIDLNLTFDCLGLPKHLENFHKILTRHPNLRAVIDHCMKPEIRNHSETNFNFWAEGMKKLAQNTRAYCKLSGIVTESGSLLDIKQLQPYVNHILTEFGSDRIMWGSDWPVSSLRCSYEKWFHLANQLCDKIDGFSKSKIFGETACRFYGLK